MSARAGLAVTLIVLVAVAALALPRSDAPRDGAPGAAEKAAAPIAPRVAALEATPASVAIDVDPATGALLRSDNRSSAGLRTPCTVEPVAAGIRCPDGTFLPLLNGVESAPPILRSEERGPLTPVVAIVVDADGWDWYEHADGATTTCRPQWVIGADGRREAHVLTLHNAPDPNMREVPPDSEPARSR